MKERSKQTTGKNNIFSNPLFILLYFLFPVAALAVPYIVFRAHYSPVLTQKFVEEITFVKYLIEHGSHDFAEGWISTKPFVPFSTRYFLTYFLNDYSTWKEALLKSVSTVYAIFAVAYLFFVSSFHAKKFYTYIILSVPAAVLGVIGLKAVYDCSYLLTLFVPALIVLGILIHGIRFKIPVPARIAVSSLAVVPVILSFLYMNNMKDKYSFDNSDLLSVNLSAKEEAQDISGKYANLVAFLNSNGISASYCTDTIVNEITVISNGKVDVAPVVSPEDLTPVEIKEDSLKNPYEKVSRESKPFYMIYDNKTVDGFSSSLALKFGKNIYSDSNYTVYSYDNFSYFDDRTFQNNIISLSSDKFDSFFFSFLDSYISDAKDFPLFSGTSPIFIKPSVDDYENINTLLDLGMKKEGLKAAFLEIDPLILCEDETELSYINTMIEKHQEVLFHAVLSYPSYTYWKNLSESERKEKYLSYESVIKYLSHNDNLNIYWPGSEKWLITNPGNYDNGVPAENVTYNLLTLCVCNAKYQVSKDSVTEVEEAIEKLIEENETFPDLSDKEIVFFGDSIIGAYHGSLSIPGATGNISGASSYNLGVGGTSAIGDFNKFVDAFVKGDTSADIADRDFLNELERFKKEHDSSKDLCFVVNYGVNDYFSGVPARKNSGSPYENYPYDSYEAAMTDGIIKLKSTYPDAKIYILSPIYCDYFESGKQKKSDVGSDLQTYRDIGCEIAEKQSLEWIDSINLIDININNQKTYLIDGVHPTMDGIQLISEAVIRYIGR